MNRLGLDRLPQLRALLRRHFLAGLLVVVPLGAILWIAVAALRAVWGLGDLLPEAWHPEAWAPNGAVAALAKLIITALLLMLLAMGTSFVGWISKQLLGKKMLELLADGIGRIPVLRSVYSALDQLLRSVATGSGQQFSRVVYIEYPRAGLYALAFVTGKALSRALPPGFLNVFVPTTPNPTSGFHLMVRESEVLESQLTVEQAFKTILSLGIAQSEPASEGEGKRAEK